MAPIRLAIPEPCAQPYTSSWRVGEVLAYARARLSQAGVDSPSLDAELLLAHTLGWRRARLYTYPEWVLRPSQRVHYEELLERRVQREPLAYLVGHREFYGLDLFVDQRVLVPRPETELLVGRTINLGGILQKNAGCLAIADIGTGCGAIAIALALNLRLVQVYATDISQPALEVAAYNCRKHGVEERIHLLCGDLLEPLLKPVDIIVANLPYVAEEEFSALPMEVSAYEPRQAWDGGAGGLEIIKRLLSQVDGCLNDGGCILLEIGAAQGERVVNLAAHHFPDGSLEVLPDGAGHERVVVINTIPSSTGMKRVWSRPWPT